MILENVNDKPSKSSELINLRLVSSYLKSLTSITISKNLLTLCEVVAIISSLSFTSFSIAQVICYKDSLFWIKYVVLTKIWHRKQLLALKSPYLENRILKTQLINKFLTLTSASYYQLHSIVFQYLLSLSSLFLLILFLIWFLL